MLVSEPGVSLEATMLAEARTEVTIADQKASQLLAALAIGYGAVFGGVLAGGWTPSRMEAWGRPLWWLAALAAVVAIGLASAAVWPRFKADDVASGVLYWGHVAEYPTLAAFDTAMEDQPPQALDRTRHQLWRISRLLKRKYVLIRGSIATAGIEVLLLGLVSLAVE